MPWFKVLPGLQLGHNGKTLDSGTVVELSAHIGIEARDRVEPCTEAGESLAHLSPEELLIAQAAPHERESLRALEEAKVPPVAPTMPTKPDPISVAPVEPNQEVGLGKDPDPISTAAKPAK